MKYIEKGREPSELSDWRASKDKHRRKPWKKIPKAIKRVVRLALRREQGYIWCYCGCLVSDEEDSHVEHLIPKDKCRELLPNGEQDYANLLISRQRDPARSDAHCGFSKGDWYDEDLMVSPLDPNCEHRFSFPADSSISPASEDDRGAKETISKLRLDCSNLRDQRSEAMNAIFCDDIELSDSDIEALVSRFQQKDDQGRFEPFCIPLIHVLRIQPRNAQVGDENRD